MENKKRQIKEWLRKNRKSRHWLAEKCLVEKNSVDDWFRSRGVIPKSKLDFIESLMSEPLAQESDSEPCDLKVTFTPAQYAVVQKFVERFSVNDLEEYMRTKAIEFAAGLTDDESIIAAAKKYGHPESGDLYAAEDDADE